MSTPARSPDAPVASSTTAETAGPHMLHSFRKREMHRPGERHSL